MRIAVSWPRRGETILYDTDHSRTWTVDGADGWTSGLDITQAQMKPQTPALAREFSQEHPGPALEMNPEPHPVRHAVGHQENVENSFFSLLIPTPDRRGLLPRERLAWQAAKGSAIRELLLVGREPALQPAGAMPFARTGLVFVVVEVRIRDDDRRHDGVRLRCSGGGGCFFRHPRRGDGPASSRGASDADELIGSRE